MGSPASKASTDDEDDDNRYSAWCCVHYWLLHGYFLPKTALPYTYHPYRDWHLQVARGIYGCEELHIKLGDDGWPLVFWNASVESENA